MNASTQQDIYQCIYQSTREHNASFLSTRSSPTNRPSFGKSYLRTCRNICLRFVFNTYRSHSQDYLQIHDFAKPN